jgi:hypothetical protein
LLRTSLTYSKLFERDLCRSKLFLRCRFRFPFGSALLLSQAFNSHGSFVFHHSGHDRSAVTKVPPGSDELCRLGTTYERLSQVTKLPLQIHNLVGIDLH